MQRLSPLRQVRSITRIALEHLNVLSSVASKSLKSLIKPNTWTPSTNINNLHCQWGYRFSSSKLDPKLKAMAIIDSLPKSSLLSKTGMITTGTVLSIAAVSNELYVVNEETVILASFIAVLWFLVKSGKQNYINWMDGYIDRMRSLLNHSRQEHISTVTKRIEAIENIKDVVDVTKHLFEVSKETVHLEAKAFELSQVVAAQQQAKSVLDSWVRYESALRQREHAYLADTVISKAKKELLLPKMQQQILDQSIKKIEDLMR